MTYMVNVLNECCVAVSAYQYSYRYAHTECLCSRVKTKQSGGTAIKSTSTAGGENEIDLYSRNPMEIPRGGHGGWLVGIWQGVWSDECNQRSIVRGE